MVVKKRVVGILLFSILLSFQFIAATADVGYIGRNVVNPQVAASLTEMGLTYELIKDTEVRSKNLNSYKLIFVDDGILRNTQNLPIYNYPSVIMNKYYGPQWGLTDGDGISQLASSDPLAVRKDSQVLQVYTQATINNVLSIPYYYLDDLNKANITSVARAYTGDNIELGDTIATANKGTRLINGKVAGGKMCFFGIAQTKYWTSNAKDLFKECVGYVASQCQSDIECDDSNTHTEDICLNPGTPHAQCQNNPIVCLSNSECGTNGFSGDNFCSNTTVKRNYMNVTCNNPGLSSSFCSNVTEERTIQQCTDLCDNGACVGVTCHNDSECNDNNPGTQDICMNPGTAQSSCQHNPISCHTDNDCGIDMFIDNPFCTDGEVWQTYVNVTCNNPGLSSSFCSNVTAPSRKQVCSNSCLNGACVTINCRSDTDCNDNNSSTMDSCQNPGTTQSFCKYQHITCFSKSDCGDDDFTGNNFCSADNDVQKLYITYSCNNAGTVNSTCSSSTAPKLVQNCSDSCSNGQCTANIRCSTDLQCDDESARTIDQCVNPGTSASFCRNTEVNCLSNLDCGVTGFTGENFCSNNNIFKTYQNSTCMNAGTLQSFCNVESSPRLIQNCDDGNQNTIDSCTLQGQIPSCTHTNVNIRCNNNGDCNDGNSGTQDICLNAGTPQSSCQNNPIGCSSESQCGTDGFVGNNFCSSNNVVKTYVDFSCNNAGTTGSFCSNVTSNQLIQSCPSTCSNGQCGNIQCYQNTDCNDNNQGTQDICVNPGTTQSYCRHDVVQCNQNSECGTDGFTGSNFCSQGNVKRSYVTYSCANAGTTGSYCTSSSSSQIVQQCSNGCNNAMCNSGNIACNTNSECGSDGFTGSNFCSQGNVKRNYVTNSCLNPGTTQSYCTSSNEARLIQTCTTTCSNGQCNNPVIACSNDIDCGVNGFVGGNFCSQGNVKRNYVTYSCLNPGTQQSYCISNSNPSLVQQCTNGCTNNQCTTGSIICYNNMDCNDHNVNTEDICLNPGTQQSYCTHNVIQCLQNSDCGTNGFVGDNFCSQGNVKRSYVTYSCANAGTTGSYCTSSSSSQIVQQCSNGCNNAMCNSGNIQCYQNTDCNDNNQGTQDICVNPGTTQSYCTHNNIACNNDAQCDDSNPRTSDQCVNPGTTASFCRNTQVNCLNNLDCGITGYTGNNFCWNNDIFKTYQTSTCVNPGTLQSYCVVEASPQQTQECNDGNSGTTDLCSQSPGTEAICLHNPTGGCTSELDCGTDGYVGDNFCSTNNVVRTYVDYSCVNSGTPNSYCTSSTTNNVIQHCTDMCSNGQCISIICYNDGQCNDNNAGTLDKCQNPGTQQSYCTHTPVICYTDSQCDDSNAHTKDTCQNPGTQQSFCQHTPIACLSEYECGIDGQVGNNFCSNNNVVNKYIDFSCNNPGTTQSYCSNVTSNQLIQSCPSTCSNGQCNTPIVCSSDPDCNDNNSSTTDSCVNPGTQQSYCTHTPLPCQNYDPNKHYDCQVYDSRVNQVLYWGNNNDWMCNRWDGNFQEKHIVCYNNQWYESDPTWDWNPWNGNFLPFENVIPPCTQVGNFYTDAADGMWKKGQVPADCPLIAKCKDVDFNCNNQIDSNDAVKITSVFDNLTLNNLAITPSLASQYKSQCSVLGSYLSNIMFRDIAQNKSKSTMTFNDITGRQDRINSCYAEQIGCIDTDGGNSISVKGQIKNKQGSVLVEDSCISSSILKEYVCGNLQGFSRDTVNGYSLKNITCPNGCSSGKCN